ncbi:hypothetical protein [Flavobacterium sp.]|uniref:hypothetical protein n=1 Tax=Flavobacterium sp. TaxID=239 RepID=UPI003A9226FE
MKTYTLTLFFLIFINITHGQTFSNKQSDKLKSYNCSLRIKKDSTVNFIYNRDDNGVYGEYIGTIKKVNDTLHRLSLTMTIGQFYMRSLHKDTIYIQLDNKIAIYLDKIQIAYSDGTASKVLQGYDRKKNPIRLLKIPVNKKLFNNKKGKDYVNITINRKNFISDNFLSFKIPFGSSASFTCGEKEEFDIVIKNKQLWTVGQPPLQTGDFKLEKVGN